MRGDRPAYGDQRSGDRRERGTWRGDSRPAGGERRSDAGRDDRRGGPREGGFRDRDGSSRGDDRRDVPSGPEIPDEITIGDLDREVRQHLRSLSKTNAETVGRHLVMVARLFDADPERAYEHAQAAVARGGRVDVVREAAGLAAYRTERYAEALRELRTVRRLNGSSEHLPIMADCERGLGRPERAIALAATPEAETLDADARVELGIVVAGARMDLGEVDAALVTLDAIDLTGAARLQQVRVAQARADMLAETGRTAEAAEALAGFSAAELAAALGEVELGEEIVVLDLDDLEIEDDEDREEGAPADSEDDAPEDDAPVDGVDGADETPVDADASAVDAETVAGDVAAGPDPAAEALEGDDAAVEGAADATAGIGSPAAEEDA